MTKTYRGLTEREDAIGGDEQRAVLVIEEGKRPHPLRHTCIEYERMTGHLPPRAGCHSPTGFSWGYFGSGPSELARMILRDVLGKRVTGTVYQTFKEQFVARWPADKGWSIREDDIRCWLSEAPWRPYNEQPKCGGPLVGSEELYGSEWQRW